MHIPLSVYPTVLFRRPVNHNPVKCFLDIISRPTVGITYLTQEMGLFEDLHDGRFLKVLLKLSQSNNNL